MVLIATVAQTPSDAPTFEQTINTLCETLGQPATILADVGFASGEPVGAIEARGIEVLVAVSCADQQRVYDFRPPKPDATPPPEPKAEWRIAMKRKMATEDAKAQYKRRKHTVEPVFGIIKNVLGFKHFSFMGIENVKAE